MSILDDLVADHVARARPRANADQLARMTDPTPNPNYASSGYLPGFVTTRNRARPKPKFREVVKRIPIETLRAGLVEERKVLRAIMQGAGVESRTYAPDPTIKPVKPWSQEMKRNDELALDATQEERNRRAEAHQNWVITQKAEGAKRRAEVFERQTAAFASAMAKAMGD